MIQAAGDIGIEYIAWLIPNHLEYLRDRILA
jgi:hypothetical protein